ncbi:FkbM family methyltransferase [Nocardia tenerifensis]|uniref:FkbM family methyltransferase n=1 Tax=Nocardia tenerifensis TaxID=228006 RepID=A0A318JV48_9NOCA|nr:FkbM family methyltransferase [Nocardia tenerifensis]PXX59333.1 FkbM family methyltransferase [Nocardia tenerifensis]
MKSAGTMARTAVRQMMWHLARRAAPVVGFDADGIRYFVHTADREIARKLFVRGFFERDALELANNALDLFGGRYGLRDRKFVDIGANIGSASLLATKALGARTAVAFEPAPANYRLLRMNILANDLEDRVRAVECALSDEEGDAWLELSPDNLGNHYLRDRRPVTSSVAVRTRTFDAFVRDGEIDLDDAGMIWMDVEGAELRVLQGAKNLLEADVPLVMEYWPGTFCEDDHETLIATLRDSYSTYLDLRDPAAGPTPTARLGELHKNFRGDQILTDILLVKS